MVNCFHLSCEELKKFQWIIYEIVYSDLQAEENENSGSGRRKKQAVKTVVEYCYEPEMEEVMH